MALNLKNFQKFRQFQPHHNQNFSTKISTKLKFCKTSEISIFECTTPTCGTRVVFGVFLKKYI
ncbi:MAG TPA: hypothetical protein EYG60_02210 [Campylobacterales bacterium]|nr:hypothetical protein [Campylobacterales bacterium]